jgi:threonylcarbamoyladenosine tRNA methylthiotransferase MtaB
MKPPEIVTFGCRLNTYESEVIRDLLKANPTDQQTIVFNTCGVTAEAVRQARQSIRRSRRENPEARIVVAGCAVQMDADMFAKMPEIDLILGNEEKLKAESYGIQASTERVMVNDIMSIKETALHLIQGFENRVRAFIQVQNGCDHRCTFCRIPFGRGNSRSVPVGEMVTQLTQLVAQGCQEVVFTGVDITDYGKDLPGQPTLGEMIARVLKLVPGMTRVRLSSLDPVEVDETLFTLITTEPRLMPHLHLSLQAGDDMILKRMKRRHLREDVIRFCERVRAVRPDVVFGADIIAGFPTETDGMFENTVELVTRCNLAFLHIFPYSAHEETPAARMPQVPHHTIKERARRLRELGEAQLTSYLATQVGRQVHLVVEQGGTGHTDHFAQVKLQGDAPLGALVTGEVMGIENKMLQVKV